MGRKRKKIRVKFSKNRERRARTQDFTGRALKDMDAAADLSTGERISGKGDVARHRTIVATESETGDAQIDVDESACVTGVVLDTIGANRCRVRDDGGRMIECTVRRLVRTLARDTRNVIAAGDRVLVQPHDDETGVVVRVEPRRTTLSRFSGHREHVIAANVDQAAIVVSTAEPPLKSGLMDRFIAIAERGGVTPLICINKIDLTDLTSLQPLIGTYARIGYPVVATSAAHGWGIEPLRRLLRDRITVFTGQSGVGKSSLLNAIQPGLARVTSEVSDDTGKGRHTTRVAELVDLEFGGAVIDTPGIRQLALWGIDEVEVEGYFREFRPYVAQCRFPNCSHTHERSCAVREAVRDGYITRVRYEGYLRMVTPE